MADSSSATLYKINVSTNTAQTFEPSPSATASYSADMVRHAGTIVRLAVGSPSTIRVFDLATGTWTSTPVTVSALTVLGAPAMWISDRGRLFMVSRSGAIAEIVGWQSPTPSYIQLLPNGAGATNGDGASCAQAAPPVGVTANDDNYTSTPILASQGGATGNIWGNDTLNLATPLASSITAAVTDDGGLTGVTIGKDGSVIVPMSAPGTGCHCSTSEVTGGQDPIRRHSVRLD